MRIRSSLSTHLLVLTIAFVMISEVLIYVPSIARFRADYLSAKLGQAHIAALTLEATPAREVSPELESTLLRLIQADAVELNTGSETTYMLGRRMPQEIARRYDLRTAMMPALVQNAVMVLVHNRPRVIQVVGPSPYDPAVTVEVTFDETPLRAAMIDYSQRVLGLSIVISLMTAALVYLTLRGWIVGPLIHLTRSMTRFRANPADQTSLLKPGRREDEIGIAQRELAEMQTQLVQALGQRAHLAAVGEAVTRINHDLRNILSSAQLVADRLEASGDPAVRKAAPRLVAAIDRAVALCSRVLEFARAGTPAINVSWIEVAGLLDEVSGAVVAERGVVWATTIAPDLHVAADRQHLFRVLTNLAVNAIEAGATRLKVHAHMTGNRVVIDLADDGPGLPDAVRGRLFNPFSGSSKAGGSGLGLAIARELMVAHGGELMLLGTGPAGTTFRLELPAGDAV